MLHFQYGVGSYQDFAAVRRFHYCAARPTLAQILTVRCREENELAGVLVLSYPVPLCAERHRVFGTGALGLLDKMNWANRHLRTISRVIVHPRYRGIGLAKGLIQLAVRQCPTPYVEARSHLACGFPLFEQAGLRRGIAAGAASRPAYYWAPVHTDPVCGSTMPGYPASGAASETALPHSGHRSAEPRRS